MFHIQEKLYLESLDSWFIIESIIKLREELMNLQMSGCQLWSCKLTSNIYKQTEVAGETITLQHKDLDSRYHLPSIADESIESNNKIYTNNIVDPYYENEFTEELDKKYRLHIRDLNGSTPENDENMLKSMDHS